MASALSPARRLRLGGARLASPGFRRLTDDQLCVLYSNCIKMAVGNKINPQNSWSLELIDYMGEVIEEAKGGDSSRLTNFQKASCTLDAGVQIYAARVDSVHTEAYKVLGGLTRTSARPDGGEDEEGDERGEAEEDEVSAQKASRKKKKNWFSVETVAADTKAIDAVQLEDFSSDPLFRKTTQAFDSGGTGGLLLNHLGVYGVCELVLDSNDVLDGLGRSAIPQSGAATSAAEEAKRAQSDPHAIKRMVELRAMLPRAFSSGLNKVRVCPIFEELEREHFGDSGSSGSADASMDSEDTQTEPSAPQKGTSFLGSQAGEADLQPPLPAVEEPGDAFEDASDAELDEAGDYGQDALGEVHPTAIDFASPPPPAPAPLSLEDMTQSPSQLFARSAPLPHEPGLLGAAHTAGFLRLGIGSATAELRGATRRQTAGERFFFDFHNLEQIDAKKEFASCKRSSHTLTKATLEKQTLSRTTLPIDQHFNVMSLTCLFLNPRRRVGVTRRLARSVRFEGESETAPDGDELGGAGSDGEDGGLPPEDDPGDLGLAPGVLDLEMDDAAVGAGFEAVAEPVRADETKIEYARVAKQVDVHKLKRNIWEQLQSSTGPSPKEAAAPGNASDQMHEPHAFSSVIEQMAKGQEDRERKNLSVPFCFVCLLHLANEKGLCIDQAADLGDLAVAQDANLEL